MTLGKRWDHTSLSVDYLVLALGERGRARGGGMGRRGERKGKLCVTHDCIRYVLSFVKVGETG